MWKNNSKEGIPLYVVDAFTDEPFKGNPAAVCFLKQQPLDSVLQAVATEMNLSETAFVFPVEEKPYNESDTFLLRWFTPEVEVPLCGHATLATAAVLFYDVGISSNEITFLTKSGELKARKEEDGILLNFPANRPQHIEIHKDLLKAMGITKYQNVLYSHKRKALLIQLKNEEDVRNLKPNFALLKRMEMEEDIRGVIVTSAGSEPYDFVSRYFAPWVGIDEDPVTGAAHTVLTPYWFKILGKDEMLAFQASKRGGELKVRMNPRDRVDLIGKARIVSKGELYL
jgi:PhzF family phenazine biosynthesis protein